MENKENAKKQDIREKRLRYLAIIILIVIIAFIVYDFSKVEKSHNSSTNKLTQTLRSVSTGTKSNTKVINLQQEPIYRIFNNISEFQYKFNTSAQKFGLSFKINSLAIQVGTVQNSFKYMINNNIDI
ncbi:hypothetical protein ACJDU8_07535 [Clostridium sp. WILCCON 0269]|uniref:Uncharacterized protein n=1 Tax=Candidatus Clostridium eludens TaxID=3381663 RepID=A0ABW8SHC3_9CLOT